MHLNADPRFLAYAHWRAHVHRFPTVGKIRPWLVDNASLTEKLRAHCVEFKLQCLHQRLSSCLKDEAAVLGLSPSSQSIVWEREVLLQCDGQTVVFAHTIVPLSATAADWPLFKTLGERSLGTTLFNDPQIQRGHLQFARLPAQHPLILRARAALYPGKLDATNLYARRCLYQRKQGLMLVTEVFLPAVVELYLVNKKY